MDRDEPSSGLRKVKYNPKPPPRRNPKPSQSVKEVADDDGEAAETRKLLHRFNEQLGRRGPKVEKKSSAQVAFSFGATPCPTIKTYGVPSNGNSGKSRDSELKESTSGNDQLVLSSPSIPDGTIAGSADPAAVSSSKMIKKEYRQPWDCDQKDYPTTLPWMSPYSGDPEILNEEEFGEASMNVEYDENTINPALELGLLKERENVEMFFLRLPDKPSDELSASVKGKEITGSSISSGSIAASAKGKKIAGNSIKSGGVGASKKGCSSEELSGGYMGKMLVYKSGAIKFKLGEDLYDVMPGSADPSDQEVVVINTEDKHCCTIGKLSKRMVITPDVDAHLNANIGMG